jgi:hypothetical protein
MNTFNQQVSSHQQALAAFPGNNCTVVPDALDIFWQAGQKFRRKVSNKAKLTNICES